MCLGGHVKPIFSWSPSPSIVGKPSGLRIMEKLWEEIAKGFPPADMMLLSVHQAHFHTVENHFSLISLGIGKVTCNDCSINNVSRNRGLAKYWTLLFWCIDIRNITLKIHRCPCFWLHFSLNVWTLLVAIHYTSSDIVSCDLSCFGWLHTIFYLRIK